MASPHYYFAGPAAASPVPVTVLGRGGVQPVVPEPLQVLFSKSTWTGPTSNEAVTITFKQSIGANDALRTGSYAKTFTFTLSTTNP